MRGTHHSRAPGCYHRPVSVGCAPCFTNRGAAGALIGMREETMLEYFPIDKNDFEGTVLITGAGGCIGSWALALLNRAGVKAAAFDLSEDQRRPKLLLSYAELAKVEWLTGDISDADAVGKAVQASGARAIIHLAALQVPFCKADPIAGAKVNVVGTINVFEAARTLGIKR